MDGYPLVTVFFFGARDQLALDSGTFMFPQDNNPEVGTASWNLTILGFSCDRLIMCLRSSLNMPKFLGEDFLFICLYQLLQIFFLLFSFTVGFRVHLQTDSCLIHYWELLVEVMFIFLWSSGPTRPWTWSWDQQQFTIVPFHFLIGLEMVYRFIFLNMPKFLGEDFLFICIL